VEFGRGEGADEDVDAGGVQGRHFIGEPVTASGLAMVLSRPGLGRSTVNRVGRIWLRYLPSGRRQYGQG
jgi:hypothetical protein